MLMLNLLEAIMKINRLFNAATLTVGLILGQDVFVASQSSAQTKISFERLETEYRTTVLADIEPLTIQRLPVNENGNYVISGIGGDFTEPGSIFQNLLEGSETKPKIQFGILTIDTCGAQGTGVCFNFPF
jgi:hypothetical protein